IFFVYNYVFFFQAEDGIRDFHVTGVQTCALPIFLSEPEKAIPIGAKSTKEDYVEALNEHRGLETFERNIDLLLDQIERLQKKNKTIRDILLQIFNASEISYQKFDAVIAEVENIFFKNIRSIINKLNAFDEEDYNFIKKQRNAGAFAEEIMQE